jgi:hypothetical protein
LPGRIEEGIKNLRTVGVLAEIKTGESVVPAAVL